MNFTIYRMLCKFKFLPVKVLVERVLKDQVDSSGKADSLTVDLESRDPVKMLARLPIK